MGNIIGIKLADGSFYPVMEEGQPFSKKLELTTVRDDQTTVHLDLYRSATGSMEDAEYVDTLVVENLVPHPKQEHSLNLNINLDENNMLSAEIDDPETGTTTNSKVSLITLEKEALAREPDYTLASEPDSLDDLDDFNFDSDTEELSELPEEIDLSVDDIQNYEDPLVGISEDFVVAADEGAVDEESDFGTVAALTAGAAAIAGGAVLAANLNEEEDLETLEEDIDLDTDPTLQNNLEEIDLDISSEDSSEKTLEESLEDDFTLPEIEDEAEASEPTLEDDFTLPEVEEPVETTEPTLDEEFALPEVEDTVEASEPTLEDDFTLPEVEEPVEATEPTLDEEFAFTEIEEPVEATEPTLDEEFAFTEIEDTVEASEPTLDDDFTLPEMEEPVETAEPTLDEEFAFTEIEDTVEATEPTLEDDFTLPEMEEPVETAEPTLDEEFAFTEIEDTVEASEPTIDEEFAFTEIEDTVETTEPTLDDDFTFDIPESEEMEAFSEGESTLTDDELANLSGFSFEETSVPDSAESQEDSFDSKDALLTAGLVAGGIAGGAILANSFDEEDSTLTNETAFEEDFSMPEDTLDNSDLPSFDDFDISSTDSSFDNTFDLEDDTPFSFDSLPDFDEIPELQENSSESLDSGDFELPDFDSTPSYSTNDYVASSTGEDALFDSLYEESYKETEKSKKRTTIPVVVCVICALICVGAVAAILWLTKPNLFGKKEETPVETPIEKEVVPVEVEKEPEPVVEDFIAAKEDEIIITPEPVVPVIPEPKEEVKPTEVIYRIKWGDTLWDLAESYYQNPWLYHKIAKANNIKNPDVIISGTDIVIPPLN